MKALLIATLLFLAGQASGQTATLVKVEENGSRGQRINIVFLSEGYTAAEMPNFATHVTRAIDFLFTREPWQQYRSYCNVYRIEIASNQSGTDNGDTSGPNGVRDTYFNTGFNTPSISQLLTLTNTGSTRAYTLLNANVPEYDVPVVLVNDTKYGGSGGPIAVASVNSSSAAIVEHEIGHSFANLADEYDFDYPAYIVSEMANNTQQTTRSLIKWNHWINASTPVPTPETSAYDNLVGLFEGSMYRTVGWYRPHNNSLMRNLLRPCGAVNREQFVLNYYSRVSPIDASAPAAAHRNVTEPESLSFSVTPKAPSSGAALIISWRIDDAIQAAAGATFQILSDHLGNGSHTVTATVRDPTAFVRLDPGGLLDDSVTWSFTLSNQLPVSLASWRTAYGSDLGNPTKDGLVNMVKYALGLDPARSVQASQAPFTTRATITGSDYLTLNVPRRMKRSDVDYLVEVSGNLVDWQSGPAHTITVRDDPTALVVRDATPIANSPNRFIRLKIQER